MSKPPMDADGRRWGWLQDAAWFGGLGLVVCGVASYSRPAGLIAAGLLMAANAALWAWAKDRLRRREQK